MNFIKELNDKQYEAVTTAYPFVRVIAGAGSGKTRVLTYRIAYLLSEMGVAPWRVLAITFTNKVANEMRERVIKLIPEQGRELRVLTFHSLCARILREEISVLGYPKSFTIFDEDDQEKLMKAIAVDHGLGRGDEIVRLTLSYLAAKKMEGRYPEDVDPKKDIYATRSKECLQFWTEYEERMARMFALDFDDLIIKTVNIFRDFPAIRRKWQQRFDHILIDEFQDTNDIQAHLVHLLLKPDTGLYVVGDPDQTIYTWRGANQGIILDTAYTYFDQPYKILDDKTNGLETIILNQNYRSTQNILNVANKLIEHNKKRVKKELFTLNEQGTDVIKHQAFSADEEASWVIEQISKLQREQPDFSYRKVAVLYRAAYLTLPLEKALIRRQIPYVIYGGLRFYQRAEVKDILAYWRLLLNPKDEVSLNRIVNQPRRGLGDVSMKVLQNAARSHEYSLYEFLQFVPEDEWGLRPSLVISLRNFVQTIEKIKAKLIANPKSYAEILREYISDIGYLEFLLHLEDGEDRLENADALFQDVASFIKDNPSSSFEDYLQNIALLSAQDEIDDNNRLLLMTVHTAKGLEFPYVFVFGVNEGVFPSNRTLEDNAYLGLEEERRLCYVAFTRARQQLFVSCNKDYSFVLSARNIPSRFFAEAGLAFENRRKFPGPIFDDTPLFTDAKIEYKPQTATKVIEPTHLETPWQVGDHLTHDKFGPGVIIELIGDAIISVDFVNEGKKKMMGNHPALHKIDGGS